jgi:ribosomal protein S24E
MLMNIQIIKDEKKPLLKRRELTGKIGYEGKTPARLEIRKELAKAVNAKEELVIVKKVKPDYGSQSAKMEANIYDDEKTMKEVEQNYMLVRHGAGEKKEEQKEEKEEKEAPKREEKKEEAKEEKKEK